MPLPNLSQSKIKDVHFGVNVKIVEPVNIYGCTIESNVFIGPFVEIQCNVTIGQGTRIQSHSFICEGSSVGQDCFIGHGVMFINDTFSQGGPARGNKNLWGKVVIGNHVSLGSNCTIMPVEICSNVVIGAGSVVLKSIHVPGVYAGNPAKLIRPTIQK